MRIMKKYDFNIVAMWEARTAKYGNLVGEVQDRTLHVTPYSPQQQLSR